MGKKCYRKEFFDSIGGNFFSVNVELMRFVCDGDYNGAVVLSQILYWHGRSSSSDGWVFKSYQDWHDEIGLSKYKMRRILSVLKGKGVIETKIRKVGGNPVLHHRLLYDIFKRKFSAHVRGDISAHEELPLSGKQVKNGRKFDDASLPHQISAHLFKNIRSFKPDFREPNWNVWDVEADRMIRLDGREPDKIWAVVNWCTQDSFWQGNVLSVAKLRKQFDALEIKMNQQQREKVPASVARQQESWDNISATVDEYGDELLGKD